MELFRDVTYGHIREHAENKTYANVFKRIWGEIDIDVPDKYDYQDCICYNGSSEVFDACFGIFRWWAFIIVVPIFVLGKLLQILLPYIIVGFLISWNKWNEVALFQLVMLFAYIALQIILLTLSVMVYKVQFWLWHIECGIRNVKLQFWGAKNVDLMQIIYKWYLKTSSLPIIEKYILELYGNDIGRVIMDYFNSIEDEDQEVTRYSGHLGVLETI